MKLNDFINKTSVKPTNINSRKITFVNQTKEDLLNKQIDSLSTRVEELNHIENQYIETNGQLQKFESKYKETSRELDEANNTINLLQKDVLRYEKIMQEKQALELEYKDLTSGYNAYGNIIQNQEKQVIQLQKQLGNFETRLTALVNENRDLLKATSETEQSNIDIKNNFEEISEKYQNLTKVFDSMNVKYNSEVRKSSLLSRDLSRVEKIAEQLQNEKDELESTRQMLQSWASAIESDHQEEKGKTKLNQAEIKNLTRSVSEMSKHIDGLINENQYLVLMNNKLKSEAAQKTYMSMGAIERAEGFKMPTGAYFKGKNPLGNDSPTLLSFKEKRHDNTK